MAELKVRLHDDAPIIKYEINHVVEVIMVEPVRRFIGNYVDEESATNWLSMGAEIIP